MSETGMFGRTGQVLAQARRELGLTQKQLAERAGVSDTSLSGYERGKQLPTLPILEKVLDALGLDAQEFGRRLRTGRGRRSLPVGDPVGWVPRETAQASAEVFEDMGALLRLAIPQVPPPARQTAAPGDTTAAPETSNAGDR